MALYEAVETLPEKHRMSLMLFAIGEYDINEIACDLHLNGTTARMSWGTVRNICGYSRNRFRLPWARREDGELAPGNFPVDTSLWRGHHDTIR